MKTIFIFLFTLSVFPMARAAEESVEVTSQINEVTVFLRGAQVTRYAKVPLQKGNMLLSFRGLPLNLNPQSVQVKGEGNFTILSIMHQVNYLAGQRKTAQVKQLQDSLNIYEDQLALNKSMQSVMKSEEDLLKANQSIGSDEKGVLMSELKQAADFFRSRLTEIKKEQLMLESKAKQLEQKIAGIKNQLSTMNAGLNKPTSEILVHVSCNENTTAGLWVTYTVNQAGWTPNYDIRAKDVQSPVSLIYNARVSQNTGEDWEDVAIRLSTANPQQRGDKPDMQPWYIDFEQPVMMLKEANMAGSELKRVYAAPMAIEEAEAMPAADEAMAPTASSFTEVDEGQTNLEFNIKIPYDIPSDNRQYTINIQENTLPAIYEYYCVPKLDQEAFLIAHITGWENYNLLSGEINLFFEGTYVGKSTLNVRNTNDTLDLSLGRDKGIVVTRVKMKDYTEDKVIGSNRRETSTWEITIRNNKKQALSLRVEDQIPVSMNRDIVVEPIDYSGGTYQKETGRLTWKFSMEPSAEKKLRIAYAVKYPKDRRVMVD